jgi:hypothetical protein
MTLGNVREQGMGYERAVRCARKLVTGGARDSALDPALRDPSKEARSATHGR